MPLGEELEHLWKYPLLFLYSSFVRFFSNDYKILPDGQTQFLKLFNMFILKSKLKPSKTNPLA